MKIDEFENLHYIETSPLIELLQPNLNQRIMEKKQTAIDWLATEILKLEGIQTVAIPDDIFHIAKQIEREQIEQAHGLKISYLSGEAISGKEYYTQTFKS